MSVVVPCIPRDFDFVPRLLESINSQRVLPWEVIVAASETGEWEAMSREQLWKEMTGSLYALKVVATEDPQTPGQNRNRAMPHTTQATVTFFDADDEMLPERIRLIQNAFLQFQPKCVVHSFDMGHYRKHFQWKIGSFDDIHLVLGHELYQRVLLYDKHEEENNLHSDEVIEMARDLSPCPSCLDMESFQGWDFPRDGLSSIAPGHVTCMREVMEDIKFSDELRGEDVKFLRSVLHRYGDKDSSIMFLDVPLTAYHPSDSANNWWTRDEYNANKNNPDFLLNNA